MTQNTEQSEKRDKNDERCHEISYSLLVEVEAIHPFPKAAFDPRTLPAAALLNGCHGLTCLAAKGFGELGHVDQRSLHADGVRRMSVGLGRHAQMLRPLVVASALRSTKKELLCLVVAVTLGA